MTALADPETRLARPRQLILTVTDRCNHACDMCYYHASLNRKAALLSLAEYERLAHQLHELELLLISGGEPFLRRDLADVVAIFHRHNRTRTLFIPTNGSVPGEISRSVRTMLDRMPDLQLTVMLSLEALAEEHDRIHGRPGAFAAVVATVRRLAVLRARQRSQHRPPLIVLLNTVVSDRNADGVLPLMAWVRDNLPVGAHTFSPMRGRGPAADWNAPEPVRFAALVRDAQPYFEHYLARQPAALKATLDRYALWLRLIRGAGLPRPCQAGNTIGVIEPDGGVRLCELTPVVGNLRDANFDFEAVWRSPAANAQRRENVGCSCTHACFINASQPRHMRPEGDVALGEGGVGANAIAR